MFFLILFGFYHVFLTGRTAAKNNIQFQPYRSKLFGGNRKRANSTARYWSLKGWWDYRQGVERSGTPVRWHYIIIRTLNGWQNKKACLRHYSVTPSEFRKLGCILSGVPLRFTPCLCSFNPSGFLCRMLSTVQVQKICFFRDGVKFNRTGWKNLIMSCGSWIMSYELRPTENSTNLILNFALLVFNSSAISTLHSFVSSFTIQC